MIDNFEILKKEISASSKRKVGKFYAVRIASKDIDKDDFPRIICVNTDLNYNTKVEEIKHECRRNNNIAYFVPTKQDLWLVNVCYPKDIDSNIKKNLTFNCDYLGMNDLFGELNETERLAEEVCKYINHECIYHEEGYEYDKAVDSRIVRTEYNKENIVIITKPFNLKKFYKMFPFIDVNVLYKR